LAILESRVEQKKASALPITALVASPLLFPHLKFQHKMACSWGKWHADAARDDCTARAFDIYLGAE